MVKKFPKTIGTCVDHAWQLKMQIAAQKKIITQLEEDQKLLNAHIKELLAKAKSKGATGKLARFELKPVTKPVVDDWDALYKYISKTKAFDLLQRRLAEQAIKDRWADKKKIPGIDKFEGVKVSLTKV